MGMGTSGAAHGLLFHGATRVFFYHSLFHPLLFLPRLIRSAVHAVSMPSAPITSIRPPPISIPVRVLPSPCADRISSSPTQFPVAFPAPSSLSPPTDVPSATTETQTALPTTPLSLPRLGSARPWPPCGPSTRRSPSDVHRVHRDHASSRSHPPTSSIRTFAAVSAPSDAPVNSPTGPSSVRPVDSSPCPLPKFAGPP
ncbi:hypothetical protein L226DRAFT_287682 [Lentinus tigrinus ALCF2SS1-7]|uniref:uncharacterized protein n=1 Tax=Lentinus tigrinus ALCF2SS1-7 TaxID=1328758 RepID=UPI001166209C|nr:hypothetical protein L226DRAFT_287682 [Lentinus tigrinus ALCF2SS1-7]